MSYRLTRRARRDELAIWVYIAENNESANPLFLTAPSQQLFNDLARTVEVRAGQSRERITQIQPTMARR